LDNQSHYVRSGSTLPLQQVAVIWSPSTGVFLLRQQHLAFLVWEIFNVSARVL